jgi:hypothetical protein
MKRIENRDVNIRKQTGAPPPTRTTRETRAEVLEGWGIAEQFRE